MLTDRGVVGKSHPIPFVMKNKMIALIAPDDLFLSLLDTNVSTNPATIGAMKILIFTPNTYSLYLIQNPVINIPTNSPMAIDNTRSNLSCT